MYKFTYNNLTVLILVTILFIQGFLLTFIYHFSSFKYFYDIIRYLTFIGLFIFGTFAYSQISSKELTIWFLIVIFYHVTVGYFDLITGAVDVYYQSVRLGGSFENVGQFGLMMGIALILFHIAFTNTQNLHHKTFIFCSILAVFILLSFNNTLRVFAALAFAYFIYYIVYKRRYFYFIVLILMIGLMLLVNKEVYLRLNDLFTSNYNVTEMSGEKLDNSFQWRIMQWYLLTSDWLKNYLVFGTGLAQHTQLHGFIAPWGEPFVAHSDFVKLLVESGLFGMPIILFLYFRFYKFFVKNIPDKQFIILFFFFLFCLLTGNTLFSNPFQMFIFASGFFTAKQLV